MLSRFFFNTALHTAFCFLLAYSQVRATETLTIADVLAVEADPDYGEYLAGECMTCHTGSGTSDSIPEIKGREPEYIVNALLEYQDKTRENETMRSIAGAMGKEEIAALAAYFSALPE